MRCLYLTLALSLCLAGPAAAQAPDPTPVPPQLAPYLDASARDPLNPYWRFAVLQTARRLKLSPPDWAAARGREAWEPRLYELTTGAAAVQEALQLDRMLGGGDQNGTATVPIDSIPGVDRPSIAFDALLDGRTSVPDDLARCAPPDWYYAHFPGVPQLRRVLDASDRWGAHLLSSYRLSGRDAHLRARLADRLLLRSTPELDPFYQLVVNGVAIVGSDPYLFEGSDLTVIFGLRSAPLFLGRMELARREASPGNARVVTELYRGWHVDGIVSADGAVSSFTAARGGIGLVGTSIAALRRVIDTANGSLPSLAASDEYRYARSVYPYSAEGEDGFLFLSDGFVRRVVGPRSKIGEARRVRCAVSLETAAYAVMLFRTERREAPASLEELFVRGFLDRGAIRCPDGGGYALSGAVPQCSVHGRAGAMTPNIEIPLERATPAEAEAYSTFREDYKTYWRQFIDPVAIRARAGDRLEVEATILPLVENSAYRWLASSFGGAPIDLAAPRFGAAVATVDVKAESGSAGRRGAEELLGGLFGRGVVDRALGDTISLQVLDAAPVVAPGFSDGGMALLGGGGLAFVAPILAAVTMPVVVSAPVRDRAALDAALVAFRDEARLGLRGDRWFQISAYELAEAGASPVEVVTVSIFGVRIRLFYGVAGDRFIVANRRELVGDAAAAVAPDAAMGNIRLELAPGRWQALRPAMELAYAEDARTACHENLSWVEAFHLAFREPPAALGNDSTRLTGFEFVCPGGGVYAVTSGVAACDVHGGIRSPRQPARPAAGSPAAFVLDSVERVSATLSFTPAGISTRVVVEGRK